MGGSNGRRTSRGTRCRSRRRTVLPGALALALVLVLVLVLGPNPAARPALAPVAHRVLAPAPGLLARSSGRPDRADRLASAAAPAPPRASLWPALPRLPAAVYIPIPVRLPPGADIPTMTAGHSDTVTLSFDDCGDPGAMGAIVDRLVRAHRQALFFVTGQCRDRYPWLSGELVAAGQRVCNHTYSHPDLRQLTNAQVRAEIANGVSAGCPYFRPPFGSWDGPNGRIAAIAAEFGLSVLMWDVDTRDWAGAEPGAMVDAIRRRGGVVLFHLHGPHTLEALDRLLT